MESQFVERLTDTGFGEIPVRRSRSFWSDAWHALIRNRLAVAGGIAVAMVLLVGLSADYIAPYDPTKQNMNVVLQGPGSGYILGTDALGRDVLSRLIFGARTSVSVGIFTQLIILIIGVFIGATAAFSGGKIDNLLMRFTDIMYAFPDLLLIILLRSIFGGSIFMIFLAIGLVDWTNMARLVRGQLLSIKERDFVLAAQAIGVPSRGIIFRHMLPHALGPVIVSITFGVPRAIFAEAALSYIGIGVQPPTPSWGSMINDGYQAIFSFPHLVLFPGIAIAVLMLSFTFLGDGLRDALDPRMRHGSR